MTSLITDEIRAKAVIYTGKEVCKEQTQRLLREAGLPNGLLPIEDPEECGHVEETGFVWLKQKEKLKHKFEKIDREVKYGREVTAFATPTKITKLTGVKAKELMVWVKLTEISVPHMDADQVTFKSAAAGISRTFPAEAFMVGEEKGKVEAEADVKAAVDVKDEETKEEVKEAENVVVEGVKVTKDENVVVEV